MTNISRLNTGLTRTARKSAAPITGSAPSFGKCGIEDPARAFGSLRDARRSSTRMSLTLIYEDIFRAQSRHMEQCSEGPGSCARRVAVPRPVRGNQSSHREDPCALGRTGSQRLLSGWRCELGEAVQAAITTHTPGRVLVPISNWAAFGGSKEVIVWLPIDMIATTITALVALRKQVIEDIYQIMGLADIMRGETDPVRRWARSGSRANTAAPASATSSRSW